MGLSDFLVSAPVFFHLLSFRTNASFCLAAFGDHTSWALPLTVAPRGGAPPRPFTRRGVAGGGHPEQQAQGSVQAFGATARSAL